jgi:3-hydroxy acid dehydrogenase / malonic semialdehyde reductase
MIDLKGKIVLITGASSGIGEACARAFAAAGADVILTARSLPALESLARELSETHGVRVLPLMLDVRHRIAVERTLGTLTADWAEVDILVNNAGLVRGMDKLYEGDPDEWDEMLDTNVKGLLLVTRAVVPGMIARGRGHVINIGSIAGRETYPGGGVYCATKYAVKALTRALRMDLLGTPIRVTTVDPGMVETNFSVVRFRGDKARAAKVYENIEPLHPGDVADAVVWAATRPARVNVSEMVVLPTAQASAMLNHRGPWKA